MVYALQTLPVMYRLYPDLALIEDHPVFAEYWGPHETDDEEWNEWSKLVWQVCPDFDKLGTEFTLA